MTENNTKICFTCRNTNQTCLYNIFSYDIDNITYFSKLKSCVTEKLILTNKMEICLPCIRHLRTSYKFRETVLSSQDFLVKNTPNFMKIEYEQSMKSESESDEKNNSATKNYKLLDHTVMEHTKESNAEDANNPQHIMCRFCPLTFPKKCQLKKHMLHIHNKVTTFICTQCPKEFKKAFHLTEHLKSHTDDKKYVCPICNKSFQRLSSQRRHLKTHDAPPGCKTKRTPYLCTVCGKSFPFSNGVQRHMRTHMGIRRFECGVCQKKFSQSTHLHVHMRTHTGEKPYICDCCGEQFSLKSCLLKHVNSRHCKNLEENCPIFYHEYNH